MEHHNLDYRAITLEILKRLSGLHITWMTSRDSVLQPFCSNLGDSTCYGAVRNPVQEYSVVTVNVSSRTSMKAQSRDRFSVAAQTEILF
jgi:hypothetical protein